MHDRDLAGLIQVRMGILVGGWAVRGPSGVPDACGTGRRVRAQENGQPFVDASLFLANVELGAAQYGKPRAVIAAILKAAQSLHQNRAGVFFSDVSNDAAHIGGTTMREPPSDSS